MRRGQVAAMGVAGAVAAGALLGGCPDVSPTVVKKTKPASAGSSTTTGTTGTGGQGGKGTTGSTGGKGGQGGKGTTSSTGGKGGTGGTGGTGGKGGTGGCEPVCTGKTTCCGSKCVDPATDVANCGVCGKTCGPFSNATASCSNSTCELTCNGTFADCNNTGTSCPINLDTDPANCFKCGNACAQGAFCVKANCQALVLSPPGAGTTTTQIAVDGTNVYWTDNAAGTVNKVPIGGGATTKLMSGLTSPQGVATDGSNVYFTVNGKDIQAVAISGMGGNTPVPGANGNEVAVDKANVYWTGNGTINKAPSGGGGPTTVLASGQGTMGILAVDATNVYWPSQTNGTIMKVPIVGGSATALASGQPTSYNVAFDGKFVYWGSGAGGVSQAPINGGIDGGMNAINIQASGGFLVAVDATRVYFTGLATIGTITIVGNATGTLLSAPGATSTYAVTTDAKNVYWTDNNGGVYQVGQP